MNKLGILHPGAMGASIAAAARNAGHLVYWASQDRSEDTRRRAESQGLVDTGILKALCQVCSILISVCPPHAAEKLAVGVIAAGFKGLYLEANAISPQRAAAIGQMMQAAGIDFVDGGIIGGPAWQPGETWLYLSGASAGRIAACFSEGPLETQILGEAIGQASALKMCYASYSKGTTALLCAALAASETLGVRQQLLAQWERDGPGAAVRAENRAVRVTAKAWRFEGEMHEIAATFAAAGLPGGFHEAAAELYHRLSDFKDQEEMPSVEAVLAALIKKTGAS